MGVGRDRGDTGHAEVEGRDGFTERTPEGQDESAEAAVDVEPDFRRQGHLSELGDRVDRAIAVVACRTDDGDGLVIDGLRHILGSHGGGHRIDGDRDHLEVIEVTRLVERRVCGLGLDHLEATLATGGPCGLAVGEHGVADRSAAAGGDQAGRHRACRASWR